MGRYFVVDPKGGLETPLELPEGGSASLSADGRRIAYTPVDREFRTWKRTRGGRAQDIWIYDFEANRSERVTSDPATDNFPMWAGDTVYFTSDRERVLNLYAHDLTTKAVRKVTQFTDRRRALAQPRAGRHRLHERRPPAPARPRLAARGADPDPPRRRHRHPGPALPRGDAGRGRPRRPLAHRLAGGGGGARRDLHRAREGRRAAEPDRHPGRARDVARVVAGRPVDRVPVRPDRRIRGLRPPAGRAATRGGSPPTAASGASTPRGAPTRRSSPSATSSSACASSTWPAARSPTPTAAPARTSTSSPGRRTAASSPTRSRTRRGSPASPSTPSTSKRAFMLGDGLTADSSPVVERGREVPVLPQQPRLQPDLQRVRVRLPLHRRDADLRRRPHPRRARAVPAQERRGEGEGGGEGGHRSEARGEPEPGAVAEAVPRRPCA